MNTTSANTTDHERPSALSRIAQRCTEWSERWIPDAYVFALLAMIAVIAASLVSLTRSSDLVSATDTVLKVWTKGFWSLLSFTLQMSLIIITGSVLATTRPVSKLIHRLAFVPTTDRGAVAFVTFVAMVSSWFNWGFSLIFSALLAKEVARRRPSVDYRALAASSFLGLGSIWAQGLSGSAALQMATPKALPAEVSAIVAAGGAITNGLIPLRHTIFLWQSVVSVIIEIIVLTTLMYFVTPLGSRARSAQSLGIELGESLMDQADPPKRDVPGDWLEHHWVLNALFVLVAGSAVLREMIAAADPLAAITLDTVNLVFLTVGVALHRTPARLMRAVKDATPNIWAVVLQFPVYGAIAALIVQTHLNEVIASWFVSVSSRETFPAIVAMYSAVLGIFVPSGGSKWVIEAPYVIQAAHNLKVHVGWVVAVYDLGEALANLLQPFWMLPVLGVLGLKAKDVMGYTFLVFLVLCPLVFILVTVLGATLSYPL